MAAQTGFPPEIREGILIRDLGICAMLGAPGCDGRRGDVADHRLGRGTGGTSLVVVNSTANGCALSWACNTRKETHADFAEEARRRGVKIEPGADAETAIFGTPLWSVAFGQWLTLDRAGAHLTGIQDATLDARRADEWLR